MIQIREAALDDIPAIARVHVNADWDTYCELFGSRAYALGLGESELRWRCALCDGDTLLVASDGGDIVGLGHARGDRIGALYLLRSHQRRGAGRALLRGLLVALNKQGVSEARFDVVAANENAIAFYRAHGAYPVGRCINRDRRGDSEDLVFAISTTPVAAPQWSVFAEMGDVFCFWRRQECRLPLLARSVSAGTHRLFPELGVDRLCHQPAGHGGP